jgi:hypothetical protein
MRGDGFPAGSIASASWEFSRVEAGLLFDCFIRSAFPNHGNIEEATRMHRHAFIENFSKGARQAMETLLARGQRWKTSLVASSALFLEGSWVDAFLLQCFRERKRVLRLLSLGMDPKEAMKLSGTEKDKEYRNWILIREFGLSQLQADALLNQPEDDERGSKAVAAYKAFKALKLRERALAKSGHKCRLPLY